MKAHAYAVIASLLIASAGLVFFAAVAVMATVNGLAPLWDWLAGHTISLT